MRDTRIGAGICLAVGLLALAAPAAAGAASDPAGEQTIRISPASASPGSRVTVSTRACGKETYGKGTSEAAGAFHLFEGDRKGVLVGEFEVPDDARAGTDTVTVKCPPRVLMTGTYRIADRTPSGGVDAGFGVPANHGAQLAAGGILLAGAAAGAVVRVRRRSAAARG
ncbi:sortase [Streptomyces sp. NBC_01218]|uniref:sortase n=1 Tax=unclassified Streptomyces TaxID=2593676 RepID=UPI0023B9CC6A|nr:MULTISPECIES: sortase [unclassified Streptomyces]WEH43156.1 sortase [Streptomyces sp. AM 2-1-1]WSQ54793.1 sortase [Streptomyces sp. NBC_01218]